tara:strand:+ start:4903 stop:5994 length:1092 start_codon:yes stop_codon:yes gene_type:complete
MRKLDFSLVSRITERCDLKCKYCYLDSKQNKDMSIDIAEELIKQFLQTNDNFAHFTWVGGEPLLKDDSFFEQIIEVSKRHNPKQIPISHSIQTNGLSLSSERLKRLKNMGFKIGVSYDGCSDIQEIQRTNKKNSNRILKNIQDANKEVGIITVLTKHSVNKVEEIYEFLRENTTFARVNFYAPTGMGLEHEEDLLPSKEEAKKMLLGFYELWKNDDSSLELKPHKEIVRSFFTGFPINCEYSAVSCYRIFGADTSGDIYTCSRALHIPEMRLGNIQEGLKNIIGLDRHQQVLKRYLELKQKTTDQWFFLSSGGCLIEAYSHTGDFMNSTYYCGEVRNALFDKINEDLKNEQTRNRLEKKVGLI